MTNHGRAVFIHFDTLASSDFECEFQRNFTAIEPSAKGDAVSQIVAQGAAAEFLFPQQLSAFA